MTNSQRTTVQKLQAAGFQIVVEAKDIVRLTKGADKRIVMADGSQKRAHHADGALLMSKFGRGNGRD